MKSLEVTLPFLQVKAEPTQFSSVQSSRSVMSNSLQSHGLQQARFPCPSPTLAACSNSFPLMPSSHLILCRPFLLQPSIFPSIRVFYNESVLQIRWPKDWSFSLASVLPVNIQDCFPLGWTGLIFLQSNGLSKIFSRTTI